MARACATQPQSPRSHSVPALPPAFLFLRQSSGRSGAASAGRDRIFAAAAFQTLRRSTLDSDHALLRADFSRPASCSGRMPILRRAAPLRAVFDRHVAPGELQLFANSTGRLRTDAQGPSGVTLDVFIDRIELAARWSLDVRHARRYGGALIGVGGELTSDRILQWRAGRRVAFPATLRRPTNISTRAWRRRAAARVARRRARGVGEKRQARRRHRPGDALAEALASARAAVRRAIASSVAPGARGRRRSWRRFSLAIARASTTRSSAGCRKRGRITSSRSRAATSRSWRRLFLFLLRVAECGPRSSALHRHRDADCVRPRRRRRIVGRPGDADGGDLFCGAAVGSPTLPVNVAALTAAILFCADPCRSSTPALR